MQEPLTNLRVEKLTTSNEAMARCLQLAALAAKSDVPVVLLGETGTGKTLLALEYCEVERLGSERMLTANARIICASNCSLRERVRLGKFREDLYQRLNGLTLLIPPLRERLEELPALIATELKLAALKEG